MSDFLDFFSYTTFIRKLNKYGVLKAIVNEGGEQKSKRYIRFCKVFLNPHHTNKIEGKQTNRTLFNSTNHQI